MVDGAARREELAATDGAPQPGAARPAQTIAVSPLDEFIAVTAVVLFLILLLRTAWISDDASTSIRVVENAVHGLGLTFNPGERVQTFTHPLWLGLLMVGRVLVGNGNFAAFGVSIAASLAAFALFVRRLPVAAAGASIGVVMLFASRAFLDYSSSGLENPLAHLLVGVLVWRHVAKREAAGGVLLEVTGIVSLLFLTRPDLALVGAPFVGHALWRRRDDLGGALRTLAAGASPAIGWTLFSIVYYGFPFPNTAYAKLSTGLGRGEQLRQGVFYLLDSVDRDPATLLGIGVALYLTVRHRDATTRCLGLGMVAYLAYVVWIGGDFMSGRFLSVPVFAAAVVMARQGSISWRGAAPFGAALLLLALSQERNNFNAGSQFRDETIPRHGIADERGFYFPYHGLLSGGRSSFPIRQDWRLRTDGQTRVRVAGNLGIEGLNLGPAVHLIDRYGLADAFLARLPKIVDRDWRVGHLEIQMPAHYRESLEQGRNLLETPGERELLDEIWRITRGPIFRRDRFAAIVRVNLRGAPVVRAGGR